MEANSIQHIRRVGLVLAMLLTMTILLTMGAAARNPATIAVGSIDYTEQVILGHLVAELLEDRGYNTTRTLGLGGVDVVFSSMRRGDLDVWFVSSGTMWSNILRQPLEVGVDPVALYEETQAGLKEQYDLVLFDPLGFNNTYVFATPRALAEQHNLERVSDLIPLARRLTVGGSLAFMGDRPEGIRGVEEVYGMKFRRNRGMDSNLMYRALELGQVDLIVAFSTHGQIEAFDLVTLEDDRSVFPPYHFGILVRGDVLDADPNLAAVLDELTGTIDDVTMARMNYEVDGHRKDPKNVAIEFLKTRGLIAQ